MLARCVHRRRTQPCVERRRLHYYHHRRHYHRLDVYSFEWPTGWRVREDSHKNGRSSCEETFNVQKFSTFLDSTLGSMHYVHWVNITLHRQTCTFSTAYFIGWRWGVFSVHILCVNNVQKERWTRFEAGKTTNPSLPYKNQYHWIDWTRHTYCSTYALYNK